MQTREKRIRCEAEARSTAHVTAKYVAAGIGLFLVLCAGFGSSGMARPRPRHPGSGAPAIPGATAADSPPPAALVSLADDFWKWRARYQPFTNDDIPRIDRTAGPRDWSAAGVAAQRAALAEFEKRWKAIDNTGWSVPAQVDCRLIGSALARVRWELDVNARWQRDPSFYVEQTVTALTESLLAPPPFDAERSEIIVQRMEQIPQILSDAKANLHPVKPFAELAIAHLAGVAADLERAQRAAGPLLHGGAGADSASARLQAATPKAVTALEDYRAWLQANLASMPEKSAIGRDAYEFFLRKVALIPYSPEEMLQMSRQEWARSVSFEAYEKQRDRDVPPLVPAKTTEEQVARATRDELAIRKFLETDGILTVPPDLPHWTFKPIPDYLAPLADFDEMDDFTGLTRQRDEGVRWIEPPSPDLGFFWVAVSKDARPIIVHEGVPGHFFQIALSRRNPDPIRRHYYDSGANEGIGFYAEEMMLQQGLFDDSPHTREIIYNFMRLRALRVEVDVKLALGLFSMAQGADYLEKYVPMDKKTAQAEASFFATTPGQAITYQIGKNQILGFLADARFTQGDKFNLRQFNGQLWMNGNVPIALQRWQYLGNDAELRAIDAGASEKLPR
jgi:uncharacterized protein (DUF885 family)